MIIDLNQYSDEYNRIIETSESYFLYLIKTKQFDLLTSLRIYTGNYYDTINIFLRKYKNTKLMLKVCNYVQFSFTIIRISFYIHVFHNHNKTSSSGVGIISS